jgi:hypothetical protein
LAHFGRVAGAVEIGVLAVGGVEDVADDPLRPGLHRGPLGLGDVAGAGAEERFVEAGLGDVVGDDAGDALLGVAEDGAGQHLAFLDRLRGDPERFVVQLRILLEAGEVAFEVARVRKGRPFAMPAKLWCQPA